MIFSVSELNFLTFAEFLDASSDLFCILQAENAQNLVRKIYFKPIR